MNTRLSGISLKENTVNIRRSVTALAAMLALGTLFVGTQAEAAPVHFRYVGGSWSHSYRSGWHRYWGGPSIGFYYAPNPVYVVPGYAAASYYSGPSYWTSNPSFGISLNLGGGGGYYGGGGHYYGSGGHYYGGNRTYINNTYVNHGGRGGRGGSFSGHGGSFHGGGGHSSSSSRRGR